jgi:hypothetical protein
MQAIAPLAGYEFDQTQNQTIQGVARYAKAWGGIAIGAGVLCVGLCTAAAALLPGVGNRNGFDWSKVAPLLVAALGTVAITNIICGCLYLGAGNSLSAVVDTQGNDVPLLVRALARLKTVFLIEAVVNVVACLLGLAIGIVALSK